MSLGRRKAAWIGLLLAGGVFTGVLGVVVSSRMETRQKSPPETSLTISPPPAISSDDPFALNDARRRASELKPPRPRSSITPTESCSGGNPSRWKSAIEACPKTTSQAISIVTITWVQKPAGSVTGRTTTNGLNIPIAG